MTDLQLPKPCGGTAIEQVVRAVTKWPMQEAFGLEDNSHRSWQSGKLVFVGIGVTNVLLKGSK